MENGNGSLGIAIFIISNKIYLLLINKINLVRIEGTMEM